MENENPVQDFRHALRERLKSPIAGTFIIAWMLINWRVPLAIIFGSVPDQDRITLVERIFSHGPFGTMISTVFLPATATVIYLFVTPLVGEIYSSWLNKIIYRSKRQKQRLEEDLREEGEYRETLRAICAALKNDLIESRKAFQKISEYAKNGQDENKGDFYSQIEDLAKSHDRMTHRTIKLVENFFGHYTGELPASYQFFLLKWVRKLSVLTTIGVVTEDAPEVSKPNGVSAEPL